MKKLVLLGLVLTTPAYAASTTFVLNIPCPASTKVVIAPATGCNMNGVSISCPTALAAGAQFANVTVTQGSGAGPSCTPVLSLGTLTGGAATNDFAIEGLNIVAGPNGLPSGYNGGATVTSTP